MSRLLALIALRFYAKHPWQLVLALAGISLGVGVYVGVDLATNSAARAFELSAAVVRGGTTHHLLAAGGDLDEDVYAQLVLQRGIVRAAPVIELAVGVASRPGRRYPLLGVDPLQESSVRGFADFVPGRGGDLARLISTPGTVLLPESLARELGISRGARMSLTARGREWPVEVAGTLPPVARDTQNEPPIVADIATAQAIEGRPGRISRIDLKLTAAQAAELAGDPPKGAVLVPADTDYGSFTELEAAFRTNLRALGLLALVVGMFLIYGTMSFAVVQRRWTLGVLRALGITSRATLWYVLLEALALGLCATAAGLVLGSLLATNLVEIVLRTIGDLYFGAEVSAAPASPTIYLRGAALGVAGTLLAGAKPALDAARAAPAAVMRRAELERGARRGVRVAAAASLPLFAGGGLLLALGPRDLYSAFAGLFGVLAACALLVPAATALLAKAVEIGAHRSLPLPGVLAVRGVRASLSRTGVATAALAIAIATVNGIGLMISSFRTSLDDWLGTTLAADLYVAFDGEGRSLKEGDLAAIEKIAGVRAVALTRTLLVPTPAGEIAVRAVRPAADGWGLQIVGADTGAALAEVGAARGVVVSERLAFARGLRVGQPLAIPTPAGTQLLPIVGEFRDFNTGTYSVVVALDWARRYWNDSALTGLGIFLEHGASAGRVEERLRAITPDAARVRSADAIRRGSLEIFDRTFQITEVLRLLAAVVAFLGVLSALLSIELERSRELAILRSLGFAPRELVTTLLAQTGLLGAAAGLAAVPIGIVLATLLVYVINRRSFGWTMDLTLAPGALLEGLALAVVAALLAGVYPAIRAIRMGLGGALREE
ncbi:MAG TPA: FtsX-like permease family protein [Gammaproteobacteria bacterium]|nr:FtsX-like permease family protein [Gammaproteobacteria bacterium]